ncbi:phage tail protein [Robbsia andropogonis]|uniref:phage tail protein n=1 Tax=Robbsia andropogonis TaxID=28092 RepID=UPI0004644DEA|nr:tail fiber protein [Robbsia andropogonis]MCP1118486.1 tail fiber protein [Robbsia andropogonis]MCP1127734.1 tail fiber protein [Robbsia andropogonis]
MKISIKKQTVALTLSIAAAAGAWSTNSFACSDTPVLGSICIMATPVSFGSFNRTYTLAAGQQLLINQNAALYALIGITYGGNSTSFNLPDLRGRVIVGADGTTTYSAGKTGGQASVTLTTAQLPAHFFSFSAPIPVNNLTAETKLSGLTGTVDLSNVKSTGKANALVMNVVSTGAGVISPSGSYLGKVSTALTAPYSTGTPDAKLAAGAIGGDLAVSVANGTTAPVTMSATATTTISGTATVSGVSNVVGGGQAVPTMPPYLVLSYYIATNGLYPSRDD